MTIDLAKINISLDQFQKMATGDFNAGEVALKSASKLTKINNHVHRLGANTAEISHEEILAIKNAFVNQVEQWRLALENFRAAAEEGAARDEEAPAKRLPASGLLSV